MAYYLTIKEKNNYRTLDINSLEEFTRLSKFKGASYSLDEIDKFTSNFDSELTLKRKLYEKGIISTDDITKEISIRMKNKNKLKKVMYGLVYKSMSKFVDDYYLRSIFLSLQNDEVFLKKLLDHYRNNYRQEHLSKIRFLLNNYSYDEISMFEALSSFFIEEIYTEIQTTGELQVKYKSLHDLGMFVYNYLSTKNKSEMDITSIEKESNEEIKSLRDSYTKDKPVYVKKRVKKRNELDGQMTFFK